MKRVVFACMVALLVFASQGPAFTEGAIDHLRAISEAQADLYEKVADSVVRINTSRSLKMPATMQEIPMNPFGVPEGRGGHPFEKFFFELNPEFQGQGEGGPTPELRRTSGIGSGIVIRVDDAGAWILTNNHVVEQAEDIQIEFDHEKAITELKLDSDPDSEKRNAYTDRKTDMALIFLSKDVLGGRKLQAAKLGDSDSLRVGEVVFTLGAPLNRGWTFAQGIVSAKERAGVLPRSGRDDFRYEGFIQTTAFINLGNSGGPLFNIDGEVVGINVAIQTAGGFSNGFIGIGFAIPSNRAQLVTEQLIEQGKVVRGWLGVEIEPPDPDDAEYYKLAPETGVKIRKVGEDSPASKGGLKEQDIILKFNGNEVHNTLHLQDLVATAPVDVDAKVEVLRGGERLTLSVPIGLQPDAPSLTLARQKVNFPELGARLRNLEPDEATYFKENGGFEGVLVAEVEEEGPLGEKQIPKWALITQIENTPVKSVEDVRELIDGLKEQSGDQKERLVMINYITKSGGNTEGFQVVKLRLKEE